MATIKRTGLPEIWPSAITGILSGDQSCLFRAWLPAHFRIEKRPGTFDFAAWKVDHTALLNRRVDALVQDGWTVTLEDQNRFRLTGSTAVLVGKPDIVARKGGLVKVLDAKTGQQRDSDSIQVAIYQIVLPMIWERRELRPSGEVFYKTNAVQIQYEETQPIREKLFALIRQLGSRARPDPIPSEKGCRYCDVQACDCPSRFVEGQAVDSVTSEF